MRPACRCSSATATKTPAREADYLDLLEQQRVQGVLITPVDPESSAPQSAARRAVRRSCRGRPRDRRRRALLGRGRRRTRRRSGARTPDRAGPHPDRLRRRTDQHRPGHRPPPGRPASSRTTPGYRPRPGRTGSQAHLTVAEGRGAGQRLAGLPLERRPHRRVLRQRSAGPRVAAAVRKPGDCGCRRTWPSSGTTTSSSPPRPPCRSTSVRQPRQLLGKTAAELLLDESSNPDHEHQRVTFTPELVVRTSTRGT